MTFELFTKDDSGIQTLEAESLYSRGQVIDRVLEADGMDRAGHPKKRETIQMLLSRCPLSKTGDGVGQVDGRVTALYTGATIARTISVMEGPQSAYTPLAAYFSSRLLRSLSPDVAMAWLIKVDDFELVEGRMPTPQEMKRIAVLAFGAERNARPWLLPDLETLPQAPIILRLIAAHPGFWSRALRELRAALKVEVTR